MKIYCNKCKKESYNFPVCEECGGREVDCCGCIASLKENEKLLDRIDRLKKSNKAQSDIILEDLKVMQRFDKVLSAVRELYYSYRPMGHQPKLWEDVRDACGFETIYNGGINV